jgi:hypothetical protein
VSDQKELERFLSIFHDACQVQKTRLILSKQAGNRGNDNEVCKLTS